MRPDPKVMETLRLLIVEGTADLTHRDAYSELCRLDAKAQVFSLEERHAWDRYAATGLDFGAIGSRAEHADKLLAERRKRFGSAT